MKKVLVLCLLAVLAVSCDRDDDNGGNDPAPVVSETPTPVGTPTVPAQGQHCSKGDKLIWCEAQFSMNFTKCRKSDDSDWANSYFKDIAELTEYGVAHKLSFRFRGPDRNPVAYHGSKDQQAQIWECGYN